MSTEYKKGDFVIIKNVDVSIDVNKEIIIKFKDPYVVHKVLSNDRFIVKEIQDF